MPLERRQNVVNRWATMPVTKPRVLGGTPRRHTSKDIQIVSSLYKTVVLCSCDRYDPVAVDALSHTITHFCATGKFRQAADREKEIAQV
jgi:hypothetical protein